MSPTLVRLLALLGVVILGAAAIYFWTDAGNSPNPVGNDEAPPEDPRLTLETPYRNVRPGVKYVGDAACESCHRDLCQSFHAQAMGRSADPWGQASRIEKFDPAAQATFTRNAFRYRAEEKDGKLLHHEGLIRPDGSLISESTAEAVIAIGSGAQARSYLHARDGSVWQTSLTWYVGRKHWDLSPGFGAGLNAERPVLEVCLSCHVNRAELVPGTANRFREPLLPVQASISCERCHGPGELHVAERTAGDAPTGIDTSIVNPRHLSPSLRDDICAQCHLQGEFISARRGLGHFDYRPGLPLERFRDVFVSEEAMEGALNFVGHVEQMASSKCSTASNGRLSCTSCHDPHADPPRAGREAYYRQACLKCHGDKDCSTPLAARQERNDACAACHMPRGQAADIVHTVVTDHRILKKPRPTPPGPKRSGGRLISYYAGRGIDAREADRDLALADAFLVVEQGWREKATVDRAMAGLKQSTLRFPGDMESWLALAKVHTTQNQWAEAWQALEQGLTRWPDAEVFHQQAATVALRLNRREQALQHARAALERNPGSSLNRVNLGLALQANREWEAAARELRLGLRSLPLNSGGRAALAVCLHYLGEPDAARSEMELAALLSALEAKSLRDWFEAQTR